MYISVLFYMEGVMALGWDCTNEQRLHFRVTFCFLQSKGASPALIAHT